jgi:hypothetical protein
MAVANASQSAAAVEREPRLFRCSKQAMVRALPSAELQPERR